MIVRQIVFLTGRWRKQGATLSNPHQPKACGVLDRGGKRSATPLWRAPAESKAPGDSPTLSVNSRPPPMPEAV